ncbi:hypothetical protein HZA55_00130 [Candidatus Poribacteria bacterium]|nr:hypothetical protein [Candidatus Poribacteria bacterium]
MEQKFNIKSKKEDILNAYEELLIKFKEKEKVTLNAGKEAEVKKAADETVVKKASSYTVEGIVKGLADLKLDLSKTLTDLSDKLITEANKLEEVQKAITIESKNLEEIHDIKIAAGTLGILIGTHEEKKKIFEDEMNIERAHWQKEQEEYEKITKERDANIKKEREREIEEYSYKLALVRKKDKDTYEEEKANLKKALKIEREVQEKELAERETAVSAQEEEIKELRAKVAVFPSELEKTVEKSKKEAIAITESQAKQKADLQAKGIEGEIKVYELKIKTLEDIAAKQTVQINTLNEQLHNAAAKVQDIAIKAIEGASGVKALTAVNEIALEQAKNVGTKK